MRPRSALRRPPSPMRPMTASERCAHRFSHALREKIVAQRHAMNLADAPVASQDAQSLTGETDSEFYTVLRNRDDASRTQLHRIATAPCSTPQERRESLDQIPLLTTVDPSNASLRVVDETTLILDSWRDEDGVLVTDEPRMLRVLKSTSSSSPAEEEQGEEPEWHRFAVGALIVSSLCTAGILDAQRSPHAVELHRLPVSSVAQYASVRLEYKTLKNFQGRSGGRALDSSIEAAASRPTSAAGCVVRSSSFPPPLPEEEDSSSSTLLVATMDLFETKAKHVRYSSKPPLGRPQQGLVIIAEPFSDAEIFQWLYVQLILKSHLNASLDPQVFGGAGRSASSQTSQQRLRVDKLFKHSSGRQGLAFAFPHVDGVYVTFPPHSSQISIASLEGVVLPNPTKQSQSSVSLSVAPMVLLGCQNEDDLPCVTSFGRYVLDSWAKNVVVHTPAEAQRALCELFDLFGQAYRQSREAVLSMTVAPRVFQCGTRSLGRMRRFPWLSHCVSSASAAFGLMATAAPVATKQQPVVAISATPQETAATVKVSRVVQEFGPLSSKWLRYLKTHDVGVFDVDSEWLHRTLSIEQGPPLGRGGSGVVLRALFRHPLSASCDTPVAVKCFIIPDGMSHSDYVKECLTDVAFFAAFDVMDAAGVCPAARAYDFFVTSTRPAGMSVEDWTLCLHHAQPNGARLCFLVSDIADNGTIGRFLTEADGEEYDPSYDTLSNGSLTDVQCFLWLYSQLTLRSTLQYTVHDMMLHGQLRGDNLGVVSLHSRLALESACRQGGASVAEPPPPMYYLWFEYEIEGDDAAAAAAASSSSSSTSTTRTRYLRFPISTASSSSNDSLLVYIDCGQGKFPAIEDALYREKHVIGCPMVDSCVEDDGMGRYWPPETLYASKYIATATSKGSEALRWAAELKVSDQQSAKKYLTELLQLFGGTLGFAAPEGEAPTSADRQNRLVWSCKSEALESWRQELSERFGITVPAASV